jgi:hypothetical protein
MRSEIYAKKDTKLSDGLIMLSEVNEELVKVCSYGGGWLRTMYADEFFEEYRKVDPEELKNIEYRVGYFGIEDYYGDNPAKGYCQPGLLWNGWAMPVFDQEGIDRVKDFLKDDLTYDAERDVYMVDLGDDVDDECRFEEYEGQNIVVDGEIKRVYGIGSGSWVWSEEENPNKGPEHQADDLDDDYSPTM